MLLALQESSECMIAVESNFKVCLAWWLVEEQEVGNSKRSQAMMKILVNTFICKHVALEVLLMQMVGLQRGF